MRAMASQITSRTIVYSTVYSASLALARGIHRWQVKFPAQRASNAENASIWWRHHAKTRLFIQASGVWKQVSASDTRTMTPSKRCLLLVISLKNVIFTRNSPVTGEFPTQLVSNVENVSIWWHHHDSWNIFLWRICLQKRHSRTTLKRWSGCQH